MRMPKEIYFYFGWTMSIKIEKISTFCKFSHWFFRVVFFCMQNVLLCAVCMIKLALHVQSALFWCQFLWSARNFILKSHCNVITSFDCVINTPLLCLSLEPTVQRRLLKFFSIYSCQRNLLMIHDSNHLLDSLSWIVGHERKLIKYTKQNTKNKERKEKKKFLQT